MDMFDFDKIYDTIESVPDNYRALFTEIAEGDDAGKFQIGDQFKGMVGEFKGAHTSLADSRKKGKSANDESAQRRISLKAYEDIMEELGIDEDSRSAESLKTVIDEIREQASNGKELKINLDKVRDEMSKKHATEIKGKDDKIGQMQGALEKHLVSEVATRALAETKGSVDLLLPHVKDRCRVVQTESGDYGVRVIDSAGEVVYGGDGEPQTVKGLVEGMKTQDQYQRAFESETPGGAGTPPGGGQQPRGQQSRADPNATKTPAQKIASGLDKMTRR